MIFVEFCLFFYFSFEEKHKEGSKKTKMQNCKNLSFPKRIRNSIFVFSFAQIAHGKLFKPTICASICNLFFHKF